MRILTARVRASPEALSAEGAAFKVLREFHPLEPRMWMDLSPKHYFWSNGVGVDISPPVPGTDVRTQYWEWWEKYMACPLRSDSQTFHSWLREYDPSGRVVRRRSASTPVFVGVRYLSIYNDLSFGQWVVMNIPHRTPGELQHESANSVQDDLRYFAAAHALAPSFWNDDEQVRAELVLRGKKLGMCKQPWPWCALSGH